MAKFLTRVELHNADAGDYQRLHEAMGARNFSRSIQDDQGTWYQLPTAEYYSFGNIQTIEVRQLAEQAVASTGKAASIITVNYDQAMWRLTPA
ncbi:type V toxin-antitoxin system endoribonuclease antitoxin GhoS [Burkholderia ubonensis]|uniref:type V toxin-antitoxin system endoribonuclease antitoxin GhoS n=1 Tax=Burkholderia ubonensis TaxID=101571 RepID=UPI0009B4E2C2|nr:type V toxin-antitoxin system endoribonuclease antitoxin GhoS [Burkholderia ubonensis]